MTITPSWRVNVGLIALLAAVLCGYLLTVPDVQLRYESIVVLACLALIAESTRYASSGTTVSVSSIVLGAAVILSGPLGATVVGVLSQVPAFPRRATVSRVFNVAMTGLLGAAGGVAYLLLGGQVAAGASDTPLLVVVRQLLPLACATIIMLLLNTACVSLMIAVNAGPPILVTWRRLVRQVGRTYLGYGVIGFLFAVLWDEVGLGPATVLVMFAPLVLAQWSYAQQHAESVAHERTVSSLVAAVEARDPIMRGRNERVAQVSELVGNELRLSPGAADALHFAALLHDVGMVAPVESRPGASSSRDDELDRIWRHPARGVEMLRSIEFLGDSITAIRHHHERWDGTGYPDGLKGEHIPQLARVLAVADAFCALAPRVGVLASVDTLGKRAGVQFDPECVAALSEVADAAGAIAAIPGDFTRTGGESMVESRWLDHDLPEVSDLLAAEGRQR